MRSGLVLLLPIAACFTANPTFGLATETDATSAVTNSSGASSGEPGATSTTALTTAADPTTSASESTATVSTSTTTSTTATTTGTTEPLASTSEAATSDTTVADSGESGIPPVSCDAVATDQSRFVHLVNEGEKPLQGCGVSNKWTGRLQMKGGSLLMTDDPECDDPFLPPDLILGKGWPAKDGPEFGCVEARIYWRQIENTCLIATLHVIDKKPNVDIVDMPLYLASLSYLTKPYVTFPMWPERVLDMSCPCQDQQNCCDPEPGDYVFKLGANTVLPGEHVPYLSETYQRKYEFHNIQSFVANSCGDGDVHLDWFNEILPP